MNTSKGKIKTIIISVISILVVVATWIFNLGWLRLFMTAVLIPHIVLFVFMNLYSTKYFDNSKRIKILNIFFVLTFLFAYVFMTDSDDISSYVFFGLVHNENVLNIAEIISTVAFVGNVVTFIMQIIGIEKIKKNLLENK